MWLGKGNQMLSSGCKNKREEKREGPLQQRKGEKGVERGWENVEDRRSFNL